MTKEEIQAKIDVLENIGGYTMEVDALKNKLKTSKSIFDLAPNIIHNKLCSELVKLAKEHAGKNSKDVPEWINLLATIETIEKIYPETTAM